jgi:uncharacterized protein (DUF2141 family)
MYLQIIPLVGAMLLSTVQFNHQSGQLSRSNGRLTVVITGFHSDAGEVSVALFNEATAFPKHPEKAVAILYSRITHGKSEAIFENLSPGQYAISVFHDENNNKKMDSNFFGVPKEGVGASNNAKGHLGPPKYQDAKFIFTGPDLTMSITITYL